MIDALVVPLILVVLILGIEMGRSAIRKRYYEILHSKWVPEEVGHLLLWMAGYQ